METIVRFKVIKEDSSKKSIKVKYDDCPDFTEITKTANFIKHPTKEGFVKVTFGEVIDGDAQQVNLVTSIEEQIDEWVGSFDKLNWMYENEVMTILTWEIVSYGDVKANSTGQNKSSILKKKELTPIENMKLFFVVNKEQISQEFVDNYTVVYSELVDNMKGIPWEKQMEIVFTAMGIATKSAVNALTNISDYSKALEQVDWNKHKYTKASDINKYGTWDMDAISREAKMIQDGHIVDNTRIISNTK